MLLLQKFHGYHLLIPNQYHRAKCLRSFDTLEKCFYLEGHALYYQRAFRNFTIYGRPEYYELRLRGCLIRADQLASMDHWLYIEADGDSERSISRLLLAYLPKHSPVYALIKGQCNDFFSLMPLQCLYQFLVGQSFEKFAEQITCLTRVSNLSHLSSAPIVNSQQVSSNFGGFYLTSESQDYLLKQNVYFYEELGDFDWWLLAKLPDMCEGKVSQMQAFITKQNSLESLLS